MLIIENFFDEGSLEVCEQKIERFLKGTEFGWTSLSWSEELVKDSAIIFIMDFPDLNEYISNKLCEIDDYLKNAQLNIQMCVWGAGSKINFHSDDHKKFAATIYLNKEWDLVDGGLFQYIDKNTNQLITHPPFYNSCIINTHHEPHQVTQIGYYVNKLRFTVQVWGSENPENQINTDLAYS